MQSMYLCTHCIYVHVANVSTVLIAGEPTHQEVAFYAYMSGHLASPGHGQQLVFQTAVTNVGNHYNRHSGIFTAPVHGVYVFSWTLAISEGHYIYTQIFVNSNAVGATYTSAYGVNNVRTTTGLVVVQLNAMDVASIRVNMNGALDATVYSNDYHKSSFSGWKIYWKNLFVHVYIIDLCYAPTCIIAKKRK